MCSGLHAIIIIITIIKIIITDSVAETNYIKSGTYSDHPLATFARHRVNNKISNCVHDSSYDLKRKLTSPRRPCRMPENQFWLWLVVVAQSVSNTTAKHMSLLVLYTAGKTIVQLSVLWNTRLQNARHLAPLRPPPPHLFSECFRNVYIHCSLFDHIRTTLSPFYYIWV